MHVVGAQDGLEPAPGPLGHLLEGMLRGSALQASTKAENEYEQKKHILIKTIQHDK